MWVRLAQPRDISAVLAIYAHARNYMKESGNPTQWGDSYPPRQLTESDIASEHLYLIYDITENREEIALGVFAFFSDGEPLYNNIEGKWLNDLPYAAIHRVASSGARKGILAECISFCSLLCENLKIDTHSDNLIMQNGLTKLGFSLCGTVFLENGEPRMAYQRTCTPCK